MRWFVVHNPAAGRPEDVSPRLAAALRTAGVDYDISVTQSAADVSGVVNDARRAGHHRFAAVGGDGTAHVVLNAMMAEAWDEPPTLAIVAAGSGSDFIRTFALPRRLEDGVALLATPDLYRCDIGHIEGRFGTRYFLNAVNVGVAAASVLKADRLPRRIGGLRYTTAFWLALAAFHPSPIAVTTGRRRIDAEAMNVVVANGQFFGGGLNVAPQAALMDGALDIEVFEGPRRRAFAVMPRVIRGLHLRHPAVTVTRSGSVEIDVPDDWPVEADGEFLGSGSVRCDVVPHALDFKI